MFNVGNNLPAPPLSGLVPGALPGSAAVTGYGSSAAPLQDGISPVPQPPDPASAWSGFGSGNGPGGFINQFMSTIFAALTQMAQYLTSMLGQPPWGSNQPASSLGTGSGPSLGTGSGPSIGNASGATFNPGAVDGGSAPGGGKQEQYFTTADLSSRGDPHDAFTGTTRDGEAVGGRWNNMLNHPNLIDSNSFEGGFRISTDVGAPNASGVTRNEEATIESDYGRTAITMKADGSYSVAENGKSIELQVGKSQDLGHGESVTLNADGSLTVVDTDKSGGEIATTLSAKDGGVGVEASAHDVDLGGYLVRHAEKMPDPGPGQGNPRLGAGGGIPVGPGAGLAPGSAWPLTGVPQSPSYQQYQPYAPFGSAPMQGPEYPSIDALVGA